MIRGDKSLSCSTHPRVPSGDVSMLVPQASYGRHMNENDVLSSAEAYIIQGCVLKDFERWNKQPSPSFAPAADRLRIA
jgi:hypothetical protein